jgi:5-(carboxyamino)imidazole ribonucleotide synthase
MSAAAAPSLVPGATIGILGGGQLGRMTALAAAALGFRIHVFCGGPDEPCAQVAAAHTLGAFDDEDALASFAAAVDVVTFEFENIPYESAAWLAKRVPVRPTPEALRIAQDRILEKRFLEGAGAPVAPWQPVEGPDALAAALTKVPPPALLKSARFGYDGKGQAPVERNTDPSEAWRTMGGERAVLESFVAFSREISVIAARGAGGETAAYIPVENRHSGGILDTTRAPASIAPALAGDAEALAIRLAQALDLVGLLAVEMFVTAEDRLIVNEIAPRPHNSGHWTIDACLCSQFEQFVRAITGLPLGSPERHSDAVMQNLIGEAVERWPDYLRQSGARLHLYGKREVRAGRKMGHVTRIFPKGSGGAR